MRADIPQRLWIFLCHPMTASPQGLPYPCPSYASVIYFYWFYCQAQCSEKRITSHKQHVLFLKTVKIELEPLLSSHNGRFYNNFADYQMTLDYLCYNEDGKNIEMFI